MALALDWKFGSSDPLAAILAVIAIIVAIVAIVVPFLVPKLKARKQRGQVAKIDIKDQPGTLDGRERYHTLMIKNKGVVAATEVELDVSWPDRPQWGRQDPTPKNYPVIEPGKAETSSVKVPDEAGKKFRVTVWWKYEDGGTKKERFEFRMAPDPKNP